MYLYILRRNPVQSFLQVDGVTLKQGRCSIIFRPFTNDGRQEEELDFRSGKASAIIRVLHRSVVLNGSYRKRQNSWCLSRYLFLFSLIVKNFG